jgi:hypothetical protein
VEPQVPVWALALVPAAQAELPPVQAQKEAEQPEGRLVQGGLYSVRESQ